MTTYTEYTPAQVSQCNDEQYSSDLVLVQQQGISIIENLTQYINLIIRTERDLDSECVY